MTDAAVLDFFVWNDQTELVLEFFEGVEDEFPQVERWYEIKQGKEAMRAAGVAILEHGLFSWAGCPRNRDLPELLHKLAL